MTPKEKAQELCDHYSKLVLYGTNAFDEKLVPEIRTFVVRCALIAVDELIDEVNDEDTIPQYLFWKEVKQEIQKL